MSENLIPTPNNTTDVPSYSILVEGSQIDPAYQVLTIHTIKEFNKISSAKIVLIDGDAAKEKFEISDKSTFEPGKKVVIKAGYKGIEKTIFEGVIIKHGIKLRRGGSSQLSLECKDKAVNMTLGRHNKYYYNKKDSDVISELIGKYGLQSDVDSTSVTYEEIVQVGTTDWDFIVARAEANGLLVSTDDGKVLVKKPDLGKGPVVKPKFGASVFEFEAEMDARHQPDEIKVISWSHSNQELVETTGSGKEASQGNIGASKLAEAVGKPKYEIRHTGNLKQNEIKAWADGLMQKHRLAKIRGHVKFQGFADVKPGDIVELLKTGSRFEGKAFATGVLHDISEGNWTTDVQFGFLPNWFARQDEVSEKPATGVIPAINGLQTGVVVKLEGDPEGEDRIQVRIPVIDNSAKGVWARVACLDAGDKRGTFFRPEVDDEVLVGFLNDDPRHPVVLGHLHSSAKPAPLSGKDVNHEKRIFTRSDMRIHFDDQHKVTTIQTPAGNKIILSEKDQSITIQDQNNNKMVMKPQGIDMESPGKITIKATQDVNIEGLNVNIKAQVGGKFEGVTLDLKGSAQLNAEGSGMATLKSSGILTVQGSLVKIN